MSQAEGLWRFTAQAWLPLAGFVLTLALALFVLSRRKRSLVHRSFAALNVAAALWNLDVFLLFTLQDAETAGAVDRLLQIPIVTIPFLGLLFIFAFLGRRLSHPVLVAFGLWTVALWFISVRPDYIAGWDRYWFGYYGRAGRWYPLFPATQIVYLCLSCWYLYREFRVVRDHLRRNQIAYLLMANLSMGLVSLDNFGPLFGLRGLPLGNLAVLLYFTIMAVTIIRFRLLDIQVLFRYGLLYSSLTFVLSGIYLLLILGLQGWFQEEVFAGSLLLPMLPALTVAFAFGPVKSSLQERLDRRFFRSRAVMRSRLADFSSTARRAESEEELWKAAWESGWSLVNPSRAAVLSAGAGGFVTVLSVACVPGDLEETCRAWEDEAKGEVGEVMPSGDGAGEEVFELHVPVRGREGTLGLCLLGPKKSGVPYSGEDCEFLRGIAAQSAMALERVRLIAIGRQKERLAAFGESAAVVSHEMRNPLHVMRGALALLRSRLSGGEVRRILGVMEEEVRRSDLFIRDFLAACREPRPHRRLVDLNELLDEFVRGWRAPEHGGAAVTLDPSPGGLPVMADDFQLSRVFHNLVRNAVEAAGEGCRVRISSVRQAGGEAAVTFADNGPGIDEELLPRIFEPFCTSRKVGTGLGLSTTRGIIEAHGGRIEAGNGRWGGAVFRVLLPPVEHENPDYP
jgi:two-component sensor histidine kinase